MSEQNSVISAEDKAQDILSLEKASIMRENIKRRITKKQHRMVLQKQIQKDADAEF